MHVWIIGWLSPKMDSCVLACGQASVCAALSLIAALLTGETITINATREQIQPFLYDPERLLARETAVYRYQPDEKWPAVGARAEVGFKTALMNIDAVNTCLAYDPETLQMEFEQVAAGQEPGHWLYTFDEQDGKTAVSLQINYTLPGKWLGQVVDRLLVERKNRQQCVDSLAALKQQVEKAVAEPA